MTPTIAGEALVPDFLSSECRCAVLVSFQITLVSTPTYFCSLCVGHISLRQTYRE